MTLAAHATAHAWLQIAEAGNYPASSCHAVNANWLKIYPPGNTAAAYVSHAFQTCSSAKVVTMTIDPVREPVRRWSGANCPDPLSAPAR